MNKDIQYREVKIKGKHGIIMLGIPLKEDTKEEIDELHKSFAEVLISNAKSKLVLNNPK